MDIYYKRVITWQKCPDNDLIDEDYISYSKSKKAWNEFLRTPPIDMNFRKNAVGAALSIKPSKINLIKQ